MGRKNAHARCQIWLPLAPDFGRSRRTRPALRQLLHHERQRPKEGPQSALGCSFPRLALDERWQWTDNGGATGVVWQVGYSTADLANARERADVACWMGRDYAACRDVGACTEWAERTGTEWTRRGQEKGQEADAVYSFREWQVVQ